MKYQYTGKSLLDLREKYGLGKSGFYKNDWWLKEDFAKETSAEGTYEIDFENKLTKLTYIEQKKELKKGWEFPHPAVIAEAVLSHYAETGERLLENWYSRTSVLDSGGGRVSVGGFDSNGLGVYSYWADGRGCLLGVASSRKFVPTGHLPKGDIGNSELLETRVLKLEQKMDKLEKILRI